MKYLMGKYKILIYSGDSDSVVSYLDSIKCIY